jgi:hypothetical protein
MFEPLLTDIDDRLGSLICLFLEDLQDHDGIGINSVNDPPSLSFVIDSELMAMGADTWHGARVGHGEFRPLLQLP